VVNIIGPCRRAMMPNPGTAPKHSKSSPASVPWASPLAEGAADCSGERTGLNPFDDVTMGLRWSLDLIFNMFCV
jgi:hypothetical protein